MPHATGLVELLVVILAAVAGVTLFERFRLPGIAAFLVVGALIGPNGFALVSTPERVQALAEFGVIFLLFEIGLELPLQELRRHWKTALFAGLLQVVLTTACAAAIAWQLGLPSVQALVMGGLIAMSSTALIVNILSKRRELNTPHGQYAVGILLFQDLCIVPMLVMVPVLSGDVELAALPIVTLIAKTLAGLVALYVVTRIVFPWLLNHVAQLRSLEIFSLVAFALVLGSSVGAEQLGLTLAIGAFIGGLALNASPYAHQVLAEIFPLRGVLLGIFFTAVGMLLDPAVALQEWNGVLVYIGAVIALKAVLILLILRYLLGQTLRTALLAGLALAQTGEFSFVLAATANGAGLIDANLRQIFIAGSIFTLLVTPFLIQLAPWIANRLAQDSAQDVEGRDATGEILRDHAIVVGFGLVGKSLVRVLQASQIPCVVIESNPHLVRQAQAAGVTIFYGDATRTSILKLAGVYRAKIVAIAISDSLAMRRCIAMAKTLAPNIEIVARTHYIAEIEELYARGANVVVAEEFEAAIDIFSVVLRSFGIPHPTIVQFADQMRDEGYQALRAPASAPLDDSLTKVLQSSTHEWVEVPNCANFSPSIEDLEIRKRTGTTIIAVMREQTTIPNPAPNFVLQPKDRLLVMAPPEGIQKLREILCALREVGTTPNAS